MPRNVISFSAAISAYDTSGQWQQGVMERMRLDVISFSEAMSACEKSVSWQCGYRGVRVGEASHPGPPCPNCGEE
eukprot:6302739-Karenia_brevis.AAC.1